MNRFFLHRRRRMHLVVMVGVCLTVTTLTYQESRSEQPNNDEPITTTAKRVQPAVESATTGGGEMGRAGKPVSVKYALDFARDVYDRINREVVDYTCVMVSRERVDGRLSSYRGVNVKIRHARRDDAGRVVPFGVYLYFRKPSFMEGREVLFVPACYDGNLIARRGGKRLPNTTLALPPEGALAMQGNRYPITEIGFQTLTRRLIELLEAEQQHDDAVIEVFPDAKIDGRPCTSFRLTYHRYRPGTVFRQAYIVFEKESRMPVYFRSVAWPTDREENPVLEEYCCRRVQLNVGLTDWDFDVRNPEYQFDLDQLGIAPANNGAAGEVAELGRTPDR